MECHQCLDCKNKITIIFPMFSRYKTHKYSKAATLKQIKFQGNDKSSDFSINWIFLKISEKLIKAKIKIEAFQGLLLKFPWLKQFSVTKKPWKKLKNHFNLSSIKIKLDKKYHKTFPNVSIFSSSPSTSSLLHYANGQLDVVNGKMNHRAVDENKSFTVIK